MNSAMGNIYAQPVTNWTSGYVNESPKKILSSKMKSFLIRLSEMRENNPDEYEKLVESTANMLIDPLLQKVSSVQTVDKNDIENTDMLCDLMNVNIYEAIVRSFFEDIQEKCKTNGNKTAMETFNPAIVRGYLQVKEDHLRADDLGDYGKWVVTDMNTMYPPLTVDNTGTYVVGNLDGSGSVSASFSSDTSPTISANCLKMDQVNKNGISYKLKPYSAIKRNTYTKSSTPSTPHLTTTASVT